jgi:hypothetical protein
MSGKVMLTMTFAEAKGLLRLAQEGAEGLFTDESAARGYLGGKHEQDAAQRGLDLLIQATAPGLAKEKKRG